MIYGGPLNRELDNRWTETELFLIRSHIPCSLGPSFMGHLFGHLSFQDQKIYHWHCCVGFQDLLWSKRNQLCTSFNSLKFLAYTYFNVWLYNFSFGVSSLVTHHRRIIYKVFQFTIFVVSILLSLSAPVSWSLVTLTSDSAPASGLGSNKGPAHLGELQYFLGLKIIF